jgi:hypothetical protein
MVTAETTDAHSSNTSVRIASLSSIDDELTRTNSMNVEDAKELAAFQATLQRVAQVSTHRT